MLARDILFACPLVSFSPLCSVPLPARHNTEIHVQRKRSAPARKIKVVPLIVTLGRSADHVDVPHGACATKSGYMCINCHTSVGYNQSNWRALWLM